MQIYKKDDGPWEIILNGDEPMTTHLFYTDLWVANLFGRIIQDELIYNFHDENGRSIVEVLAEEAFNTYCNTDRTPIR